MKTTRTSGDRDNERCTKEGEREGRMSKGSVRFMGSRRTKTTERRVMLCSQLTCGLSVRSGEGSEESRREMRCCGEPESFSLHFGLETMGSQERLDPRQMGSESETRWRIGQDRIVWISFPGGMDLIPWGKRTVGTVSVSLESLNKGHSVWRG